MDQDAKIYIEDIVAGQEVASYFLLSDLRLGQTKAGKPFVGLKLNDRTGRMEARVWDGADSFFRSFADGDVAYIRGVADSFQNQTQLKVMDARVIDAEEVDPALFLPSAARDPLDMWNDLIRLVKGVYDPHLQELLFAILGDPDLAAGLRRAPAAKRFHHAYIGGLLEHTLSVARAALAVAPLYPNMNADLLLTGAILHDLGKVREFDQGLSGDYTDEGRLLGHLVIGVGILEEKLEEVPGFPPDLALLLKHLIISHHGENELGSPKKPKILEGLALHLLDDLDAKMNGIGGFIKRHKDETTGWTDFNRLMNRFFLQPSVELVEPPKPVESAEPVELAAPAAAVEGQPPESAGQTRRPAFLAGRKRGRQRMRRALSAAGRRRIAAVKAAEEEPVRDRAAKPAAAKTSRTPSKATDNQMSFLE